MTERTKPILVLAVLAVLAGAALSGCGKVVRGVGTALAGEAAYDVIKMSLQELRRQDNWRADVICDERPGLITTEEYGYWKPQDGRHWLDTKTNEPRHLGFK